VNVDFDLKKNKYGQNCLVLFAKNNEIIGRSEMYKAKLGMENGIASVKQNAPISHIEDLYE